MLFHCLMSLHDSPSVPPEEPGDGHALETLPQRKAVGLEACTQEVWGVGVGEQ